MEQPLGPRRGRLWTRAVDARSATVSYKPTLDVGGSAPGPRGLGASCCRHRGAFGHLTAARDLRLVAAAAAGRPAGLRHDPARASPAAARRASGQPAAPSVRRCRSGTVCRSPRRPRRCWAVPATWACSTSWCCSTPRSTSAACELDEVARLAFGRRRGAPLLRRALTLCDGRSESPLESLLRVLHVLCGIPVEPQFVLLDEDGGFVARGDLWLKGTTTLHEYDGGEHRKKQRQRKDLAAGASYRQHRVDAPRLHRRRGAVARDRHPARRRPVAGTAAPSRTHPAVARPPRSVAVHAQRDGAGPSSVGSA